MAIDGGGGSVQPDFGWVGKIRDNLIKQVCCLDARVIDCQAVGRVVAAVDAATGKVDAHIGAFEMLSPWADVLAIPVNGVPGRCIRAARENGYVMPALLKETREHLAYLPAASGHDDAQP